MPQKTKAEWASLRKLYESGDVLIKDLASKFDVSSEAIRKRSIREHWHSPRRIEQRARRKLIERNEETLEKEADKWAKAYLGAREDLLVASRHAIRRFREDVEGGQIRVRDFRELPHLLSALDKACATEAQDKAPEANLNRFGLNLAMLASRPELPEFIGVVEAPVPDPIEV